MTDLTKSPARIAGMFDAIAAHYDFLNHLLSAGIDRWWRRRAIASLQLTGRERVLDLCTGTGDLAIAAVTARPRAARVVGVDFSGAMLDVGQGKVRRSRLEASVQLVRGDATRIPAGDGVVDVVTAAFGIRNVVNTAAAFEEMYRVLAPGGRFAILEFATPTLPGIRTAYRAYSTHVLPRIGALFSRHNEAYGYLPASIQGFVAPEELVALLESSGFTKVIATPLTFGIVMLYTGRR